MKTFLNVLYRRILYKIPLKLLLVLIAVFGILFACFSNAEFSCVPMYSSHSEFNNGTTFTASAGWNVVEGSNVFCIVSTIGNSEYSVGCDGNYISMQQQEGKCFTEDELGTTNICVRGLSNGGIFGYVYFSSDCLTQPYNSLQCQTEYNLIPISSVDQNYCTSNNLCPASGPSDCPNVGVSNLFINDIFHPGAFNIIMNIPEEIDWDYAYTNSGQNFNIDVVGYNVDYEKVQSVIDLQNYKPTDDDFSQIISVLAPYSKIIIFFVVLFSLWAMIKKPFKSKKL